MNPCENKFIHRTKEHKVFKDFETTKLHLTQLADIINKFKSEAVQLRLVDLIFAGTDATKINTSQQEIVQKAVQTRPRRKSRPKSAPKSDDGVVVKKRTSSGNGAVATLVKIFDENYFKQPRSIGDICAYCEVSLARRIKANEISGKLGRMVRSRQLSRTKNSDNQYVYTNSQ
jgi:hypothetical protein